MSFLDEVNAIAILEPSSLSWPSMCILALNLRGQALPWNEQMLT
jgi:hypothetical protein